MALLQPRMTLKVSQRQVLTPGLMQMVSVLALNKLELKEMIDAEMVENPVLEEIDESVPMLDEVAGRAERQERLERMELLDRPDHGAVAEPVQAAKDSFEEVDFGSYFQDYLDPGYRTQPEFEESDKPSFEHFLSQQTSLSDHLAWQLGSLTLEAGLHQAADYVIGNLDEDGYLAASEDELAAAVRFSPDSRNGYDRAGHDGAGYDGAGHDGAGLGGAGLDRLSRQEWDGALAAGAEGAAHDFSANGVGVGLAGAGFGVGLSGSGVGAGVVGGVIAAEAALDLVRRAIELVQSLDPAGVGARDLRECLLIQIAAQQQEVDHLHARQTAAAEEDPQRSVRAEAQAGLEERRRSMEVAALIVDQYLHMLQKRDVKDLARVAQITPAEAHAGIEFIRTLDPRPGRQYNREQTRLIEPDVVFVKRGADWEVAMNEEDLPSLRLSSRYRRMLVAENTDKEVKDYVKERFRSAMQLMRNIAQRKSTILRTCEVIVRRQRDFLDLGVEALRPMMIKEVAEEIGVHPSTVSRAVANKYAHTPQGVIELRFFFSEGSNGPEGADTPLLVLKRKVRKLIEEENVRHPLTDDQLAAMLQAQGIQLTRRTVAKYREDMGIQSTHQRRRRDG